MKTVAMIFALALVGSQALAQEQTRIYGPDGRSLGMAAPYGTGRSPQTTCALRRMFRRSSSAVATNREGHRSPR
jgi:hypothetical protein